MEPGSDISDRFGSTLKLLIYAKSLISDLYDASLDLPLCFMEKSKKFSLEDNHLHDILPDLKYFKSDKEESKIRKKKEYIDCESTLYRKYGDYMMRCAHLFEKSGRIIRDIRAFLSSCQVLEMQRDDFGRLIVMDMITQGVCILLALDRFFPESSRERLVVGYYRKCLYGKSNSSSPLSQAQLDMARFMSSRTDYINNIDEIGAKTPKLLSERLGTNETTVTTFLNCLRSSDICGYSKAYKKSDNFTFALYSQSIFLFCLLLVSPSILSAKVTDNNNLVSELITRHFRELNMLQIIPGITLNLRHVFKLFKSVDTYIRSMPVNENSTMIDRIVAVGNTVKEISGQVNFWIDSAHWNQHSILKQMEQVTPVLNRAFHTIKWLMLHCRDSKYTDKLCRKLDFTSILNLLLPSCHLLNRMIIAYKSIPNQISELYSDVVTQAISCAKNFGRSGLESTFSSVPPGVSMRSAFVQFPDLIKSDEFNYHIDQLDFLRNYRVEDVCRIQYVGNCQVLVDMISTLPSVIPDALSRVITNDSKSLCYLSDLCEVLVMSERDCDICKRAWANLCEQDDQKSFCPSSDVIRFITDITHLCSNVTCKCYMSNVVELAEWLRGPHNPGFVPVRFSSHLLQMSPTSALDSLSTPSEASSRLSLPQSEPLPRISFSQSPTGTSSSTQIKKASDPGSSSVFNTLHRSRGTNPVKDMDYVCRIQAVVAGYSQEVLVLHSKLCKLNARGSSTSSEHDQFQQLNSPRTPKKSPVLLFPLIQHMFVLQLIEEMKRYFDVFIEVRRSSNILGGTSDMLTSTSILKDIVKLGSRLGSLREALYLIQDSLHMNAEALFEDKLALLVRWLYWEEVNEKISNKPQNFYLRELLRTHLMPSPICELPLNELSFSRSLFRERFADSMLSIIVNERAHYSQSSKDWVTSANKNIFGSDFFSCIIQNLGMDFTYRLDDVFRNVIMEHIKQNALTALHHKVMLRSFQIESAPLPSIITEIERNCDSLSACSEAIQYLGVYILLRQTLNDALVANSIVHTQTELYRTLELNNATLSCMVSDIPPGSSQANLNMPQTRNSLVNLKLQSHYPSIPESPLPPKQTRPFPASVSPAPSLQQNPIPLSCNKDLGELMFNCRLNGLTNSMSSLYVDTQCTSATYLNEASAVIPSYLFLTALHVCHSKNIYSTLLENLAPQFSDSRYYDGMSLSVGISCMVQQYGHECANIFLKCLSSYQICDPEILKQTTISSEALVQTFSKIAWLSSSIVSTTTKVSQWANSNKLN